MREPFAGFRQNGNKGALVLCGNFELVPHAPSRFGMRQTEQKPLEGPKNQKAVKTTHMKSKGAESSYKGPVSPKPPRPGLSKNLSTRSSRHPPSTRILPASSTPASPPSSCSSSLIYGKCTTERWFVGGKTHTETNPSFPQRERMDLSSACAHSPKKKRRSKMNRGQGAVLFLLFPAALPAP